MSGKRSKQFSPYFRDMRYGTREHLSEMEWQRGILSKETDTMLVGEREAIIDRVLSDPQEEGMPDSKITPDGGMDNFDDIEF